MLVAAPPDLGPAVIASSSRMKLPVWPQRPVPFRLGQVLFQFVELRMKVCNLLLDWRRRNWDARIGAVATIDGAVEKCVKAVVFLLGDRVVFVRMTLGAHHRQAEPGGGRSRDAVLHRFGSIFLVITAAFIIGLGIAVETG